MALFLPPTNVPPAMYPPRPFIQERQVVKTVNAPVTRMEPVTTTTLQPVTSIEPTQVVETEARLVTPTVAAAPAVVAPVRNWYRIFFIVALVLLIVGLGLFIWFAVDNLNGQQTVWIILSVIFGVLLIALAVYYFWYSA